MVYYKYFSILVYFTYFTRIGKAHVSLTFPPARRLDLDFLDNIRYDKLIFFSCFPISLHIYPILHNIVLRAGCVQSYATRSENTMVYLIG